MKVKLIIEVLLDHENLDKDSLLWYENEIFVEDGSLLLHSNIIGDTIGVVKKVRNITWMNRIAKADNQK